MNNKLKCRQCDKETMQPTKSRIPSNPPATIFECTNCGHKEGFIIRE